MTPTQREAALRLAESLRYFELDEIELIEAADLLCELAAEPVQEATPADMEVYGAIASNYKQEPEGEPVAWWCKHPHGGGFMTCDEVAAQHYMHKFRRAGENGPTLVPLYAAPQQRQPLSEEQIYAAISDQVFWATSKNFIVRVVRDVEAAHGIGEAA